MNYAIILAGGVGRRMGATIPKQFVKVYDKPIIVYTLEVFERHPMIDVIEIVCVEGYQGLLQDYIQKFNLKKVKYITRGGDNCQASIRNGIYNLEGVCKDNDVIILHMAASPLVGEDIITDCIEVTKMHGNAASAESVLAYTFCVANDGIGADDYIEREKIRLLNMPLGYKFGEMIDVYKRAYKEGRGIEGNVYANTLYVDYGKEVFFCKSSRKNIKITTWEDVSLFKAYLNIIDEEKEATESLLYEMNLEEEKK